MDMVNFGLPNLSGYGFYFSIGAYATVSLIFYYYPNLLHRKKILKEHNFVVVSHRGGSGENKENTISAFEHSERIGTDVIELDCHITKDGQVVVSHDNNLLRLCGVNKLISDINYDELPDLLEEQGDDIFMQKSADSLSRTVSSSLISNSIQRRSQEDCKKPHKIPLLEDIFKNFPNTPINLDVKLNNDNLIQKVSEMVAKYKRENITVWGSFNEKVTKKLFKLNPNVGIYFSSAGCAKLLFLMISGLLPFFRFKETHLEIIMPNRILKNRRLIPRGYIALMILIKTFFIRKSFVEHLKKRGILVYYWVLNEEEEFKHAIEIGVNGIITDYPSRLIHYLRDNKHIHSHIVRPNKNE